MDEPGGKSGVWSWESVVLGLGVSTLSICVDAIDGGNHLIFPV
jgi:hypothetical protein